MFSLVEFIITNADRIFQLEQTGIWHYTIMPNLKNTNAAADIRNPPFCSAHERSVILLEVLFVNHNNVKMTLNIGTERDS